MRILFLGGKITMTGSPGQAKTEESSCVPAASRVLSPREIAAWISEQGDDVFYEEGPVDGRYVGQRDVDLVVSYNYAHILSSGAIAAVGGKAINLHISYLPFNRGYHPYVWSILDETPCGVTIHVIDPGIDSGDILVQARIDVSNENHTVRTYFYALHAAMQCLFKQNWSALRKWQITGRKQQPGTLHYRREYGVFRDMLEKDGWDTRLTELRSKWRVSKGTSRSRAGD